MTDALLAQRGALVWMQWIRTRLQSLFLGHNIVEILANNDERAAVEIELYSPTQSDCSHQALCIPS